MSKEELEKELKLLYKDLTASKKAGAQDEVKDIEDEISKLEAQLAELEQAEKDSSPAKKEKEEVVSTKKSASTKEEFKANKKARAKEKPDTGLNEKEVKASVPIDVKKFLKELEQQGLGVNFPISYNRKELDVLVEDIHEVLSEEVKYKPLLGKSDEALRERIKDAILEIDKEAKEKIKAGRKAVKKVVEQEALLEDQSETIQEQVEMIQDSKKKLQAFENEKQEAERKKEEILKKREENRENDKKVAAHKKYSNNISQASRDAFRAKRKFFDKGEKGKLQLKEDKKTKAFACIESAILFFKALAEFTGEKLGKQAIEDLIKDLENQAGIDEGLFKKSSYFKEELLKTE